MTTRTSHEVTATDVARRMWLASLGVVTMAREQGEQIFATLAERGEELARTAEKKVPAVGVARGAADDAWKTMTTLVEAQLNSGLHWLGVPTSDELARLNRKVERLSASVDALKARR